MSHRRPMGSHGLGGGAYMGANGASPAQRVYSDKNSLHRCVIALCSNPAVTEGVCAMHLSRNGQVPVETRNVGAGYGGNGPPPMDGHETPDRFYRSGAHMAMQPRALPAAKKQRTGTGVEYGSSAGSSMGGTPTGGNGVVPPKQYGNVPLTRESINQMVQKMKYSKAPAVPGISAYNDNPYLSSQRPSVSTPSANSESETSMDADKETNLRRERNRIAARKSRQRKLDRISNLEEEKQRLEQHRDMLVQEIRSLEKKDSGMTSTAIMTITDKEYAQLQHVRMQIIKLVEEAYNSGDIFSTVKFLREDSIVSGPQNSSVHLRGKDALVLDYLCTTYLFDDIYLQHTKIDSGGPRSQHFRVHWEFSGTVKSPGVSMNKEFLDLIGSVKGKRVTIEGVSNFSFSGEKIVYVHRTADQAKFLSALVNLSKK